MIYDLTMFPAFPEEPTDEYLIGQMRNFRDLLLQSSDWTQVADAPVDKQAWADYRQALRDFPTTWTPSDIVEFPSSP